MPVSPLVVNSAEAAGESAYVLSGGTAMLQRLWAASDLYHMEHIHKILLMRLDDPGSYAFKAEEKWTRSQWHVDYLNWLGVPTEAIKLLDSPSQEPLLGTLAEARLVALSLSDTVSQLVIVTSPQHTRRSLLAFRRTLPSHIIVSAYAGYEPQYSSEFYHPLWLEYLKLLVYWFVA